MLKNRVQAPDHEKPYEIAKPLPAPKAKSQGLEFITPGPVSQKPKIMTELSSELKSIGNYLPLRNLKPSMI